MRPATTAKRGRARVRRGPNRADSWLYSSTRRGSSGCRSRTNSTNQTDGRSGRAADCRPRRRRRRGGTAGRCTASDCRSPSCPSESGLAYRRVTPQSTSRRLNRRSSTRTRFSSRSFALWSGALSAGVCPPRSGRGVEQVYGVDTARWGTTFMLHRQLRRGRRRVPLLRFAQ